MSRLSRRLALLRISESCALGPCEGYRLPALDFWVAKGEPGSFRKMGPKHGRQAQMIPIAGSKEYQMMAPVAVPCALLAGDVVDGTKALTSEINSTVEFHNGNEPTD